MTEFTTKSGAAIVINPAPWVDAKELKKAIEASLIGSNINLDFGSSEAGSMMANLLLKIDSNPHVEIWLYKCLSRCLRNGQKIVEETFNDIVAREDYYEIVSACIKENFAPLIKNLFFMLSELQVKILPTQKSDQKPA